MEIRRAIPTDVEAIKTLYHAAFAAEESELVAQCALTMLGAAGTHCSLVAVQDEAIVGHVAFSELVSVADNNCVASILAPLAVHPQQQGAGIGSALVAAGFRHIRAAEVNLVFVYGDPAYYGRFGFTQLLAQGFAFPYPLQYPDGMQAIYLNEQQTVPAQALSCVPALQQSDLW